MDKRIKAMYYYMLSTRIKFQSEKARITYACTMVLKPTQKQAGFRKYFIEFLNKYRRGKNAN